MYQRLYEGDLVQCGPHGGGGAANDQAGWDDQLSVVDGRPVEPVDRAADGQGGHPLGVLGDGGEVDVGEAGQAAVVVADHADVAGHGEAGAVQHVEGAGGAAVVEHRDGGGSLPGGDVEEGAGGGGAVVFGEPAGQDAGPGVEAVPAHRLTVAAAAVGGAGGAATVDVGDATVTDVDEVVNGLVESLVVGGADDVDGAVADGAGHHDHGQAAGQGGQVGRGCLRAEEDDRLAAVLQQAAHSLRLIAGRGDGAERQLIADPVGRLVEAGDEVAMEGVLDAEDDPEEATAAAAQQAGPGVRAVTKLVRGQQHPLPRLGTRPRDPADDDRYQRRGHARPRRDIGK